METRPILRGDLYYADLEHAVPQSVYGSAQRGARPIVILSNNVGNRYSHTVIGAVLTTASKKNLPTHVHIGKNFGLPRNWEHRINPAIPVKLVVEVSLWKIQFSLGIRPMRFIGYFVEISPWRM